MRLSLFVLFLASLALSGCGSPFETSYRIRVTVELDTPAGVRTGSNVIEIRLRREYDPLYTGNCGDEGPVQPYRARVTGEAIPIDLNDGRTVYALLLTYGYNGPASFPSNLSINGERVINGSICRTWLNALRNRRLLGKLKEPADLGLPQDPYRYKSIPVLATFGNPADPRSINVLDPRDLEASLGPGFRLRRVTIAPTKDRVTEGLVRRLPWLAAPPKDHFDPYSLPAKELGSEPQRLFHPEAVKRPLGDDDHWSME